MVGEGVFGEWILNATVGRREGLGIRFRWGGRANEVDETMGLTLAWRRQLVSGVPCHLVKGRKVMAPQSWGAF